MCPFYRDHEENEGGGPLNLKLWKKDTQKLVVLITIPRTGGDPGRDMLLVLYTRRLPLIVKFDPEFIENVVVYRWIESCLVVGRK